MAKQKNRGNRDHIITFWCDKREFGFIRAEAGKSGLPRGRYCREILLGQRRQAFMNSGGRFTDQEAKTISMELKRIGNNLNQLARIAHTTGQDMNKKKLSQIRQDLVGIYQSINEPKRRTPL